MDSQEAAAQLNEAGRVRGAVRNASRWYSGYLAVMGVGALAFGVTLALSHSLITIFAGTALWLGFVAAMAVYAVRQKVQAREFAWTISLSLAGWGVLWGVHMMLITGALIDQPSWATVVGVAQAGPLFLGAILIRWRR